MAKTKPQEVLSKKIYIFCEGAKTEPSYLKSYIEHRARGKSKVISVENTKKNTPVQLVDEAIAKKKSKESTDGDVFWVVYDRESVSKYPREKHKQAYDKAIRHGINVAISNVCFEFWIILHFEKTTQPYSSYDDLYKNSPLREHLKKINITKYEKGDSDLYYKLRDGVDCAKKRAKAINKQVAEASQIGSEIYDYSPYTNIHELLDEIDRF
ncbi:RloB family protein [Edwardsiella piscicida]|uniref:RloB family protein n=1 Tax=Edwardsiella piscicida TaxID=1263550 RepID=UPI00370D12DB